MYKRQPSNEETALAMTPFTDARVRDVYWSYPPQARKRALTLRALIFEGAASLPEVGPLTEALRSRRQPLRVGLVDR
jgi:hypothetical protein